MHKCLLLLFDPDLFPSDGASGKQSLRAF